MDNGAEHGFYQNIENKLLILYLIDKMDIPLSDRQIAEFVLPFGFMSDFDLSRNLAEMTQNGFLDKSLDINVIRYSILGKGGEALEFFEKRLPPETRGKINQYVIDNRRTIKKDYEINANYFYDHTYDEYIVKCAFYEDERMLMELNVSVVSNEQAKNICANWKENAAKIFKDIILPLVDNAEETPK